MGSCPFLHKSSLGAPKVVLTTNLYSNSKHNIVSTSEKEFLSLIFKELCIRNNSKIELEKTTFSHLLPFKVLFTQGLFGESLFANCCQGAKCSINEENFLALFEKILSNDLVNVSEEIFKICDFSDSNQLSVEDIIRNVKTYIAVLCF